MSTCPECGGAKLTEYPCSRCRPYWGEAKKFIAASEEKVAPEEVQAADMCPNCVTPWKCNGPHISKGPGFTLCEKCRCREHGNKRCAMAEPGGGACDCMGSSPQPLNERLAHYYLNLSKPGVEYDLIKDLDFENAELRARLLVKGGEALFERIEAFE